MAFCNIEFGGGEEGLFIIGLPFKYVRDNGCGCINLSQSNKSDGFQIGQSHVGTGQGSGLAYPNQGLIKFLQFIVAFRKGGGAFRMGGVDLETFKKGFRGGIPVLLYHQCLTPVVMDCGACGLGFCRRGNHHPKKE
ncbi:hypothetical protein AGMMS49991_03610 [Spirochaetia bacterium]|nr:hypothetical protein AGMMS49991_03610 [Spirochaetia bacterium]